MDWGFLRDDLSTFVVLRARPPDFCADRRLLSLIQINRNKGAYALRFIEGRGRYRGCTINARKAA